MRTTQPVWATWALALLFVTVCGTSSAAQTVVATVTIPGPGNMSRVAVDPTHDRLYLLGWPAQSFPPTTLFEIDANTHQILRTAPYSIFFTDVVFNPNNGKLYLPFQLGASVRVIDATTFAESSIPVPGCPTGIDIDPQANKIYVTSQCWAWNDKLFIIDGATHTVAGPFDQQGVAGSVRVNPATKRAYTPAGTSCANHKTRVFDGITGAILADLPNMSVLGVDPVRNQLYAWAQSPVDCHVTSTLVLDGSSHAQLASLPMFGDMAFNPELGRAYLSLSDLNQVVIFETVNHTEVTRVSLPNSPHLLAVDRTTARIYVSHNGSTRQLIVLEGVPDEFFDGFDSPTLDLAWTVIQGTCDYSLTENSGHLRYRPNPIAQPLGCGLQLMRQFSGDHWILETEATYFTGPSGGGRQSSLSINLGQPPPPHSTSATDSLVFWRQRDDWTGCCPGELVLVFVENGQGIPPGFHLPLNPDFSNVGGYVTDSYLLRIRRSGRTVTFEVSDDGVNVRFSASHTFGSQIDSQPQYYVIHGNSYANWDSYADYDYVRLSKAALNQPPTADAGPDQTVECTGFDGASVALDGAGSSDPDGDTLSYEWRDGNGNVVGNAAVVNLTLPLGSHTFTFTVGDGKGGTASDIVVVNVVDTTPPLLTLANDSVTVVVPTARATGAVVDVLTASGASATDVCCSSPTVTTNAPAEFPLGLTSVTITATDCSGLSSQQQFSVHVVYNFIGFLQPINNDGSSIFKSGRTIPIKFQLTAADGSYVTNATATLSIFKITDAVLGSVEELTPEASGNSNTDNLFRFDPSSSQYIYNLSTKGYSTGTYLLRVSLNDQTVHEVQVSIR